MDEVILIDEYNNIIGKEEKLSAHITGKLHRAFSILIFNEKRELLIHKRAKNKYHSGGLFSNSCCSHPKPFEKTINAAHRRLKEELGFDCTLTRLFNFKYYYKTKEGLIENEYDIVYKGEYNGKVNVNKDEIEDFKWANINWLKEDMIRNSEGYTYWFKLILDKIEEL